MTESDFRVRLTRLIRQAADSGVSWESIASELEIQLELTNDEFDTENSDDD